MTRKDLRHRVSVPTPRFFDDSSTWLHFYRVDYVLHFYHGGYAVASSPYRSPLCDLPEIFFIVVEMSRGIRYCLVVAYLVLSYKILGDFSTVHGDVKRTLGPWFVVIGWLDVFSNKFKGCYVCRHASPLLLRLA